jgi:hypothetical protein
VLNSDPLNSFTNFKDFKLVFWQNWIRLTVPLQVKNRFTLIFILCVFEKPLVFLFVGMRWEACFPYLNYLKFSTTNFNPLKSRMNQSQYRNTYLVQIPWSFKTKFKRMKKEEIYPPFRLAWGVGYLWTVWSWWSQSLFRPETLLQRHRCSCEETPSWHRPKCCQSQRPLYRCADRPIPGNSSLREECTSITNEESAYPYCQWRRGFSATSDVTPDGIKKYCRNLPWPSQSNSNFKLDL